MWFGLAFGSFGLVFVAVFVPWTIYRDWQLDAAGTQQTTGRIVEVIPTHLSIGHTKVMDNRFEFTTAANGPVWRGDCFTTGSKWKPGAQVTVRYRPEEPALACVQGARLSEGGGSGFVVLVFPLFGTGVVGWCLLAGRRAAELLRSGTVGEAVVRSVERKTLGRNSRTSAYEITLQRTGAAQAETMTMRMINWQVIGFLRGRLASQQPVFMFSDPARPKRAVFPESLL